MKLQTDHPIAVDSPDHLTPWGTKRDNHTSIGLLEELELFFGRKFSLLDLGCAGGQFVIDATSREHTAIGLEGSDYSVKHKQFNWSKYHNIHLFTCDAAKPFALIDNNGAAKFDCITSWEFLEHINEKEIDQLLTNIAKHMDAHSIFIGQYATTPDTEGSTQACADAGAKFKDLHQCIHDKKWWDAKFSKFFSVSLPYPFHHGVRDEHQSIRYFLML